MFSYNTNVEMNIANGTVGFMSGISLPRVYGDSCVVMNSDVRSPEFNSGYQVIQLPEPPPSCRVTIPKYTDSKCIAKLLGDKSLYVSMKRNPDEKSYSLTIPVVPVTRSVKMYASSKSNIRNPGDDISIKVSTKLLCAIVRRW